MGHGDRTPKRKFAVAPSYRIELCGAISQLNSIENLLPQAVRVLATCLETAANVQVESGVLTAGHHADTLNTNPARLAAVQAETRRQDVHLLVADFMELSCME